MLTTAASGFMLLTHAPSRFGEDAAHQGVSRARLHIDKGQRTGDGAQDDVPTFWHWWLLPAAVASAFLGGLVASLLDLQKATELSGGSQKLTVC